MHTWTIYMNRIVWGENGKKGVLNCDSLGGWSADNDESFFIYDSYNSARPPSFFFLSSPSLFLSHRSHTQGSMLWTSRAMAGFWVFWENWRTTTFLLLTPPSGAPTNPCVRRWWVKRMRNIGGCGTKHSLTSRRKCGNAGFGIKRCWDGPIHTSNSSTYFFSNHEKISPCIDHIFVCVSYL